MVANLSKVGWIAGGCFMLCGLVLAVLAVQLAADPDKWQAVAADESALAAARGMLYPGEAGRGQPAAWRPGGLQQGSAAPFGAGGGAVAVAAAGDGADDNAEEESNVECQGLLSSRREGAGEGQRG